MIKIKHAQHAVALSMRAVVHFVDVWTLFLDIPVFAGLVVNQHGDALWAFDPDSCHFDSAFLCADLWVVRFGPESKSWSWNHWSEWVPLVRLWRASSTSLADSPTQTWLRRSTLHIHSPRHERTRSRGGNCSWTAVWESIMRYAEAHRRRISGFMWLVENHQTFSLLTLLISFDPLWIILDPVGSSAFMAEFLEFLRLEMALFYIVLRFWWKLQWNWMPKNSKRRRRSHHFCGPGAVVVCWIVGSPFILDGGIN